MAWPVLDTAAQREIAAFGSELDVEAGHMLYRAGGEPPNFFVVLEGEVEIVREGVDEVVVATHGPGRFVGELNLLTGQRPYLSARVSRAGRVLSVTPESVPAAHGHQAGPVRHHLPGLRCPPGDASTRGCGSGAIRLIGSRFSPEALALRAFANRARLPHTWVEIEDLDDVAAYLAESRRPTRRTSRSSS